MEIKNYFAQDAQGNIMPSANCYLYLPGTTTLATGLIDGNGVPISNPFLASSIGQVTFGAPNGVYDLRISQGARDTTVEIQCADLLQALNETASFLGAKSSAPTTRNDGSALQIADRYFNTSDQLEYLYKSTGWVANNLDGQLLATSQGASLLGAVMQDGSPGTIQQAIYEVDENIRQDLASPNGSLLIQLFPSASSFFESAKLFTAGTRVGTRTGLSWDVTAINTGEFNHPVTGQGLTPIAHPNGDMPARAYNIHRFNTGAGNYSGITLALTKLSANGAGILELPFSSTAEPLTVSGKIAIPDNVGAKGSAWNKTVISFDTSDGGITWGSGSILEDVDLRGNGIAAIGLIERGEYNRASARRVRIQDFTKWGAAFGMVGAANNSLFEDFQVKFCGEVNIAICQTLNCTFMNFNSDLSTPSTLAARGIKVFDLYPSGTSNQQCRNTRFIGGIHERGSSDYQVEIERATQLSFIGTEFNNGSTATCKVSKGDVVFVTPHGTLNGTNKFIEVAAGARVKIYAPNFSGTEGRALAELLVGPVQIDGSLATQTLSANLRWQDPAVSGVATFTRDTSTGSRIVSASGGGANRALIASSSGVTLAGKPRVYEIKITISAIASGVVKAYLSLTGSPFRILAGTLAPGLNTFSVVTDQPSLGATDLLGDAGFDITVLTVEVRSY